MNELSSRYRFFLWYMAFADVFRLPAVEERPGDEQAGWSGGFDLLLGNPPWGDDES